MTKLVRFPSETSARRSQARAFTLIELLIVIGLTAVLFALLLVPLVSAIRYTQQAQIVTAAQDAVRVTRERLTRELGSALFVFDGTSHPFLVPGATPPASGDDRYTNFLDLQLLNSAGAPVVAHAYAAKLDFVLPKFNDNGKPAVDPTTNEPITYRQTDNGSAIISNPSYVFPLAAGTTMVRYWIGLKDPTKPYNNTREGKANGSNDNNYILYRAQFRLSSDLDPVTNKPKVNPDGTTVNESLFAPKYDGSGKVLNEPDLDDPDFFRYVNQNNTTDVNWLNDTHAVYATAEATAHNSRVDNWLKIAKTIIPGPDVDLILLPHNADNTLTYDPGTAGTTCSAAGCPGIAHSGLAHDPVTDLYSPIVNTSVTFRAATVSGDAAPGTTSDYASQGLPPSDGQSGYAYIPTVYTATSRSWSLPFHVTLYPGNYDGTQEYYATQISSLTDTVNSPPLYNAGDLLEYSYKGSGDTVGTLVYSVTGGYPLQSNGSGGYKLGGTDFVPLSVNPDTGTLNFASQSFPAGPVGASRNSTIWNYIYDPTADTDANGGVDPSGVIDLKKQGQAASASPLTDASVPPASAPNVKNAHIVPGGIRVTGPDLTVGSNYGATVPYVEVNSSQTAVPGDNQYVVDYLKNTITVSSSPPGSPSVTEYLRKNPSASIGVVYNYQANMTLADPTKGFLYGSPGMSDNVYLPMQVKLDYQTRDLIDVSIGVRIYDITNNRAQVIPSETKIKIGNSNR